MAKAKRSKDEFVDLGFTEKEEYEKRIEVEERKVIQKIEKEDDLWTNIDLVCINLESRSDRKRSVTLQFDKNGLNVRFFNAIRHHYNDSVYEGLRFLPIENQPYYSGNWLSHFLIIEEAYKNNKEGLIIFEDDVHLCEDFKERFKKVIKYKPDYGVITYLSGLTNQYTILTGYNEYYLRVLDSLWGIECYYLDRRGIEIVYEDLCKYKLTGINQALDICYRDLYQRTRQAFLTIPTFAYQSDLRSDVNKAQRSYIDNRAYFKEKM